MDALLTLPEDFARHKATSAIANTLGVVPGGNWVWKPAGKDEKKKDGESESKYSYGGEEVDLFSWDSDGGSNVSYDDLSWDDDEEEEKSTEKSGGAEKEKDNKSKQSLPSNFWR